MKFRIFLCTISLLLYYYCHSQELPISLAIESKGGLKVAGLFPDPIMDASISPVLLESSRPMIYLGGRLERKISIPGEYIISPLNYGHTYFIMPLKSWNIGIYLNEKTLSFIESTNQYIRYRTGQFILNKIFTNSLRFGFSFQIEDFVNQRKFTDQGNYHGAPSLTNESHYGYLLYGIGIAASLRLFNNLSLLPSIHLYQKNHDESYHRSAFTYVISYYSSGEFPGQNGVGIQYNEKYDNQTYTGMTYKTPKINVLLSWKLFTSFSFRFLASYLYSKYQQSHDVSYVDKQVLLQFPSEDTEISEYIRHDVKDSQYDTREIRLGFGTTVDIFNFLKGFFAVNYQRQLDNENRNTYSIKNYNPHESFTKVTVKDKHDYLKTIISAEAKISETIKITCSESLYWNDYYSSYNSSDYNHWLSRHGMSDFRFGIESKLGNRFLGWLFFKVGDNYLVSDLYFQLAYKF